MEHPSYFVDFLNDYVNLDEKRLTSLDTSITAIQDCIADSDYGAKVRFFRNQGSLAHGTIIRPQNGSEFDADILMVVRENEDWEPKKYLYDLKRVLNDDHKYAGKVSLSDVCATIKYSGVKRVDIVPILEIRDEDNKLHICHHRYNQVIRTEPLVFTDWLIERNLLSGGNSFRKVTRLLKFIKVYKGNWTCPSVLLTTLIGMQIKDGDKGSADFENVPRTLRTILSRLDDFLAEFETAPAIPNPSLDSEDFGKLWKDGQFENFKSCIATYRMWVDEAFEETDHNQSLKKWRKLLGEEFAENKDKVVKSNSLAEAVLPLALDAGHPDSLVDMIVKFGTRLLGSTFYNPQHLQPAPWPKASYRAYCNIAATYHKTRSGSSAARSVENGEPLQGEGNLRFACTTIGLPKDQTFYYVKWRITNTGVVARMKGALRGGFYEQEGHFYRWESLSYRGVHFVEAFVIDRETGQVVAESEPFNVVIQ